MDDRKRRIYAALDERFGAAVAALEDADGPRPWPQVWQDLATRGCCRAFSERKVAPELIDMLCALALTSPSKSDLQQRDIIIVEDRQLRAALDQLLATGSLAQTWIPGAPALLIFCANNRRQRQLHAWRGQPFANDHLDVFFNAALDAGIALSACVTAAEAAGLGCAPISAIRNHAFAVSDLLGLPEHVFPVAGLGLGWPSRDARISPRLPLACTVHRNRFDESGIKEAIEAYDRRRHALQPIRSQRTPPGFGEAQFYGWSEDKVRQYAGPERADWGAFVRAKGFRLD